VARNLMKAVERNRSEVYVAGMLRQAVVTKTLVPPLLRWGTARVFKTELAEEKARR
jgi:hypothetical protein